MGVELPPRYYALRLSLNPDGNSFWEHALDNERRPYKTYNRAYQACVKANGIKIAPKRRHAH
jgi:hypothetical protein